MDWIGWIIYVLEVFMLSWWYVNLTSSILCGIGVSIVMYDMVHIQGGAYVIYLWLMCPRRYYIIKYAIIMLQLWYMIIVKIYVAYMYMWSQSMSRPGL